MNQRYSMKVLHVSYHKGCINDFYYVCEQLGISCEVLSSFQECISNPQLKSLEIPNNQHYNVTYERAEQYWNEYKEYFEQFDCVVTSDTAPLSRIFLQNNWQKKLVIWICNRFDYAHGRGSGFPDVGYYQLIQKATTLPNVHIIGYTAFENVYCKMIRKIDIGNNVITPIGCVSESRLYDNFEEKRHLNDVLFVPPYNNDTIMLNLAQKLESLGLSAYTGRYDGPRDLTNYKAVVHIPYAWSNLAFFEMFHLGIVYFIPSKVFLMNLISTHQRFYWSPPFIPQLLALSEWYNPTYEHLLIFFDSWNDLKQKISDLDYEKHRQKLKQYGEKHKCIVLDKWNDLLQMNEYTIN